MAIGVSKNLWVSLRICRNLQGSPKFLRSHQGSPEISGSLQITLGTLKNLQKRFQVPSLSLAALRHWSSNFFAHDRRAISKTHQIAGDRGVRRSGMRDEKKRCDSHAHEGLGQDSSPGFPRS